MKSVIILSAIVISAAGCVPTKTAQIDSLNWLMGTWESKTAKTSIYETWTKASNKELSGKSFMLKGNDTSILETVRIVRERQQLYYIPTVSNQNNNQPVRFKLKTMTNNAFIFENMAHDFPQLISYTKINADSIVAIISGTKNGRKREVQFPMNRIRL